MNLQVLKRKFSYLAEKGGFLSDVDIIVICYGSWLSTERPVWKFLFYQLFSRQNAQKCIDIDIPTLLGHGQLAFQAIITSFRGLVTFLLQIHRKEYLDRHSGHFGGLVRKSPQLQRYCFSYILHPEHSFP